MSELAPFSDINVQGTDSFLDERNYKVILESGLSSQFLDLTSALCDEICSLYEITDLKLSVRNEEDLNGYLLDLSVLLSELECPFESITCGPLEKRFDSTLNRQVLIQYLISEVKTARLFAHASLNEPSSSYSRQDDVWEEVKNCLNILAVPKPASVPGPRDIIRSIMTAAVARLSLYNEIPVPIFATSIDSKRASALVELVKTFNQDCRARNLLFLKRIDVTINSFLWSDRVKVFENDIMNLFAERRNALSNLYVPGVSDLLAATQYILVIEQASSAGRRANTKSLVHPLAKATPPSDRGGRTDPQSFARKINENSTRRNR